MAPAVQHGGQGARVRNDIDSRESPGLLAVAGSAAMLALAIYTLNTASGRKLFNAAIELLDDFSSECARFREACTRAQLAVSDGWQTVKGSNESSTGGRRETVF
jgi:hypothetical protein